MHKKIAIAGIHTGIGKTVVSAIIAKALDADYWKPVQAGSLHDTDTMTVQRLANLPASKIHEERFRLEHALSPHTAASMESVQINLTDFMLPQTGGNLVVETAGGLMSPLNDELTMLDLVRHLSLPVLLVSANYLGSINHTMLTLEVLRSYDVTVLGIVFSGEENTSSESFILKNGKVPLVSRIPFTQEITVEFIAKEAEKIKTAFKTIL